MMSKEDVIDKISEVIPEDAAIDMVIGTSKQDGDELEDTIILTYRKGGG